jgi:hypothetical protein
MVVFGSVKTPVRPKGERRRPSRYDYQRTLSDISGWDIRAHQGDQDKAVRHIRSWLAPQAHAPGVGAALITGKYLDFQEWWADTRREFEDRFSVPQKDGWKP